MSIGGNDDDVDQVMIEERQLSMTVITASGARGGTTACDTSLCLGRSSTRRRRTAPRAASRPDAAR